MEFIAARTAIQMVIVLKPEATGACLWQRFALHQAVSKYGDLQEILLKRTLAPDYLQK